MKQENSPTLPREMTVAELHRAFFAYVWPRRAQRIAQRALRAERRHG